MLVIQDSEETAEGLQMPGDAAACAKLLIALLVRPPCASNDTGSHDAVSDAS